MFSIKTRSKVYGLRPLHPAYWLLKEKEETCSSGAPETTFHFYIPPLLQGFCRPSTLSPLLLYSGQCLDRSEINRAAATPARLTSLIHNTTAAEGHCAEPTPPILRAKKISEVFS